MSGIIDLTGDDESAPSSRPPVADPSDSEDEDLKLAIALSLQDQKDVEDTRRERLHANEAIQSSAANTVEPQTTSGLLGLDRKTMEAERLARLKRKREVDVQEEAQNQKSVSVEKTPASPPPARKQKTNLMTMTTSTMSAAGPKPNFVKSTALSRAFTDPQVLLTSSPSRLTSSGKYESISFPDILHPPSPNHALKSVLLSSFVADLDWALPHFNTRTTKFLIILHAHNAQHRALLSADFVGLPNVKLVLPEIIGAGTMHSKLMLLFYHQHSDRRDGERDGSASDAEMCRVVVPSANLTPADWGVGGIMENVLFVVDLPLKAANPNPGPGPGSKIYHFENGLKDLLRAMDVPERVRQKIDRFDFEATENVRFVFSRSGSSPVDVTSTAGVTDTSHARGMQHIGNFFENRAKKDDHGTRSGRDTSDTTVSSTDVTAKTATPSGDRPSFTAADATSGSTRTGLLSLHDAVVSLGLDLDPDASPSDPAHAPYADFVTSSLGNLSSSFATQLYLAICGRLDPTKVGGGPPRSRKPKTKSSADGCDDLDGVLKEKLKIYFPTSETVLRSRGGPSAAGTICFREKWWDSNDLIRNCLYDCVGVRGDGILMHSKVLYVRFTTPKAVRGADGCEKLYAGWGYVGSANLSESAWGRTVSDAKTKQPKFTCRNWESGVVIPIEVHNTTAEPYLEVGAADGIGRQSMGRRHGRNESAIPKSRMTSKSQVSRDVEAKAEDVRMRVKAGKYDMTNYLHSQRRLDRGPTWEEDTVQSPELPSLSEVFHGKVPVPIQHSAFGHTARQQKPWFFTGQQSSSHFDQ